MTRQQAADAAGMLGLYILPTGNKDIAPHVTATEQSVPIDTEVSVGTVVEVKFLDTKVKE